MGSALYIALEKNIPDFDTMIDGKMLGKAEKPLAAAAKRLGVTPLMEFFSTSADELADLLGDDANGIDVPPTKWFSAEDGLKAVDALLAEIERSPELQSAKDDLRGFQRVLREAQKRGIRWHLAIVL